MSTTPNAATITWTDPTTRTDGTSIYPDTFSVQIYDSASPTPATPIGSVAEGIQTFTTPALSVGMHNFTLTVTDSEGDVSTVAGPFPFTISPALAAPNPVTGVVIAPATV